MPGPSFPDTVRGARFFDVTLPRIADELANIATALGALHTLLRQRLPAAPTDPAPPPASRK